MSRPDNNGTGLRKIALIGVVLLSVLGAAAWQFLPSNTNQGYAPDQPIPFSHKKHAGLYKIDCRYCHTSAYKGPHAGVPPLSTCMGCHTVVKTESPWIQQIKKLMLKVVRLNGFVFTNFQIMRISITRATWLRV